jgi:hypothetical protein
MPSVEIGKKPVLSDFVKLPLLDDGARNWLRRKKVPDDVFRGWPGPIVKTKIATNGDRFELDPDGEMAFVHPVWYDQLDVEDFVAWRPKEPARWWTANGVELMGAGYLTDAYAEGWPLVFQPTPLDWLVSFGFGVCVLDWPLMRRPKDMPMSCGESLSGHRRPR